MDFSPNKTPIEIINEGAFGGTYFRDIYSNVTGEWHEKSWKEFSQLKNIDQKYYCFTMLVLINIVPNAEHRYWINKIDPYDWF